MAEPITREEFFLNSIANGESAELTPITREEMFLAKAGGQDVKTPTPITRKEMFLSKISNGGVQLQEKTIEITENGTTEITADEGKALSRVTAVVSVPTSTASKLPQVVDKTITELTAEDLAGITRIGRYAFTGCSSLTSITIPNSVTSINNNGFYGCTSLPSITIPNSVTEIGSNAFAFCEGLSSITMPNSVTTLGGGLFYGCKQLKTVRIGNGITNMDNAFSSSSVKNIYIDKPENSISGAPWGATNATVHWNTPLPTEEA